MTKTISRYTAGEEKLNIYSHGLGFILSIPAGFLLLQKAAAMQDTAALIAASIFAFSLLLLYLASTLYHASTNLVKRQRLNIFDHAAIYVLIAGTYTPVAVITLGGFWGLTMLIIIWTMALAGIIFKLFFTGRFGLASTIAYVVMGCVVIIALKPMMAAMSQHGLILLAAGGLSYILGALLYQLKHLPFNHVIFHVFVLIGSACHFMMVYQDILGAG